MVVKAIKTRDLGRVRCLLDWGITNAIKMSMLGYKDNIL